MVEAASISSASEFSSELRKSSPSRHIPDSSKDRESQYVMRWSLPYPSRSFRDRRVAQGADLLTHFERKAINTDKSRELVITIITSSLLSSSMTRDVDQNVAPLAGISDERSGSSLRLPMPTRRIESWQRAQLFGRAAYCPDSLTVS